MFKLPRKRPSDNRSGGETVKLELRSVWETRGGRGGRTLDMNVCRVYVVARMSGCAGRGYGAC